jgi:hypothetical protein
MTRRHVSRASPFAHSKVQFSSEDVILKLVIYMYMHRFDSMYVYAYALHARRTDPLLGPASNMNKRLARLPSFGMPKIFADQDLYSFNCSRLVSQGDLWF